MSVIDEVKQKTDIVEIVGQYVTLKKSGRNLSAPCPFHSEKHPSFFVYPDQQSWHCFGACNTGGDVFSFIMKKEGYDFGEALRVLAERAGVELPSYQRDDGKREERDRFHAINDAAAVYFHNNLLNHSAAEKARQYVEKRGYTQKTVADFTLGYALNEWEALKNYLMEKGYEEKELVTAGLLYENEDGRTTDRFRGKLIIPIRDNRGRVTGFGARVLDDSLPKYVNSPQTPTFDKSSTLYAIDRAAPEIRKQDCAIVMEGYMDVLTAHQNGVANTVASMGTAITEAQVNILRRLSKNLVLAMDADAAGEEAMLRTVIHENTLGAEIRVVVLPEGRDPDDVIREDVATWQQMVENAVPLIDFLFDKTTAGLDLATAGDKSRAADKLVPVLQNLKDEVRRTHYFQLLARMLNVDVNTLMKLRPQAARPVRRKTTAQPATTGQLPQPLASTSAEDYVLSLLLQNPKLGTDNDLLLPELFTATENREIFLAWQQKHDLATIQQNIAAELQEHLDKLLNHKPPATRNNIQEKLDDSVRRLHRKYLKGLALMRSQMGEPSDDIGVKLHELDTLGDRRRSSLRR